MKTACADTGSSPNCMSESFAKRIGVAITPTREDFGQAIKGHRITACGTAQVYCKFPEPPSMLRSWQFYVFDCLSTDVICGLEFLRITETQERYTHRLHDIETSVQAAPQVRSIGYQRGHLKCWFDGRPVMAFADTGSEVSMVSPKFAKTLGYYKGPGGKPYNSGEPIQITLADNSRIAAVGAIDVVVSLFEPTKSRSSSIPSAARLTDTHVKSPATKETASKPVSMVIETFHVFESLDEEALLSESLLAAFDAYTKHIEKFGSSTNKMEPRIAVAGKNKKGEGSGKQHTPLSEEQKFRNEFFAERDRHIKEKEDIADRLLQGLVLAERATAMEGELEAKHQEWARRNKSSLDKYFPDYYDTIIPRVNLVRFITSPTQITWIHQLSSKCEDCGVW